ncbi:MAG: DUF2065 domain-containing protein [Bradyrhizobiaceae bacterium]|nr:MAG: DUF2065 domain-containing protein [Bradyrhizobiaceae bacterium]
MRDFFVGLGMVFVIEGLVFAAFPGGMRKAMQAAIDSPELTVRILGLVMAVLGLLLVWYLRWAA